MRTALVAMLLAAACGTDPVTNNNNGGDGGVDAPGTPTDAFVPPAGYTRLIGRTWTLPAGTETYRCVRLTIAQDTYLTNILAQAPAGTHHTVLSISDSGTAGADGEYNCSAGELGMVMLYASGVGTSPLDFPSGVGVKIAAGTQLHLNLHLFNATDAPISGDSALLVKSQPTPTAMLAEMVFAGKFLFSIPANTTNYDVVGGCTANTAYNLFAIWPHMHQYGVRQKFEFVRGGTPTVLHDAAYSFMEQNYDLKSPEVQIEAGDQIRVTCTYTNPTASNITFGDSSTKEMCFTGLYRYPAQSAGLFQCTDAPGGVL